MLHAGHLFNQAESGAGGEACAPSGWRTYISNAQVNNNYYRSGGAQMIYALQVMPGANQDYKQYGREYERFGNANYGAVGRALGFDLETLQRSAGAVQYGTNLFADEKSKVRTKGTPWGESPYGDAYESNWGRSLDQEDIEFGSMIYESNW